MKDLKSLNHNQSSNAPISLKHEHQYFTLGHRFLTSRADNQPLTHQHLLTLALHNQPPVQQHKLIIFHYIPKQPAHKIKTPQTHAKKYGIFLIFHPHINAQSIHLTS